jgi:soluble lytic murein transglycosylase-like protein
LVFPLRRALPGTGASQGNGRTDHQAAKDVGAHAVSRLFPDTADRLRAGRDKVTSRGFVQQVSKHCPKAFKMLVCLVVALGFHAVWGRSPSREFSEDRLLPLETKQASAGPGSFQIGNLLHKFIYTGSGLSGAALPGSEARAVEQDISTLMNEFGAEEATVPEAFTREVHRFIREYRERERTLIAGVLVQERARLEQVRLILRRDHLPEDLAYMILVESRFLETSVSHEGAAGFWQFTETTAREYGMEVNDQVDERLDLLKSTEAASRYIRDLILDFGTGSSVMLAIAAYNGGAETVRRAVRNVKDPIKQRNFWHLYSTRALPSETLAYVPKVIATILVARNPQRFGF